MQNISIILKNNLFVGILLLSQVLKGMHFKDIGNRTVFLLSTFLWLKMKISPRNLKENS